MTASVDPRIGATRFTYDSAGRLLSEGIAPHMITYEYAPSTGERSAMTVVVGTATQRVEYGYDPYGRLDRVGEAGADPFVSAPRSENSSR